MRALDSSLLREFLKRAGNTLKGEWILLGGTLLPAVGLNVRSTVDIDFVSLAKSETDQLLDLMKIAEKLKLPVESINQAAWYFLEKKGYTRRDLLPLHKGKNCVIHRPSAELYFRLKCGRLSPSDAIDCQHYLQYCLRQGDTVSIKRIQSDLQGLLKESALSREKLRRVEELLSSLRT